MYKEYWRIFRKIGGESGVLPETSCTFKVRQPQLPTLARVRSQCHTRCCLFISLKIASIDRVCGSDFIKGLSFPIEEVWFEGVLLVPTKFSPWSQATKVDITTYLQNRWKKSCIETTCSFNYLGFSFGSPARLDYGTGHELNFIAFLCCLELLSVLDLQDRSQVALKIFVRYTGLTRTIQQYFRWAAHLKVKLHISQLNFIVWSRPVHLALGVLMTIASFRFYGISSYLTMVQCFSC